MRSAGYVFGSLVSNLQRLLNIVGDSFLNTPCICVLGHGLYLIASWICDTNFGEALGFYHHKHYFSFSFIIARVSFYKPLLTMVTIELKKAARVILVGAPGVGKGTQAERLMKRFPQLSAVSSGDLLRDNVRNKTTLGSSLSTNLY